MLLWPSSVATTRSSCAAENSQPVRTQADTTSCRPPPSSSCKPVTSLTTPVPKTGVPGHRSDNFSPPPGTPGRRDSSDGHPLHLLGEPALNIGADLLAPRGLERPA